MYPLIHSKPKFLPYDIVRIKETKELALIQEASNNTSQKSDLNQWNFSLILIEKESVSRMAWYSAHELEQVNNIFELIAKASRHPFCSSNYEFNLEELRRKGD